MVTSAFKLLTYSTRLYKSVLKLNFSSGNCSEPRGHPISYSFSNNSSSVAVKPITYTVLHHSIIPMQRLGKPNKKLVHKVGFSEM